MFKALRPGVSTRVLAKTKRNLSFLPGEQQVQLSLNSVIHNFNVTCLDEHSTLLDHLKENFYSINNGQSFHTFDLGAVEHRFAKWRHYLPRVDPWYAVKCNPDPVLTSALFSHGTGFDCASRAEIDQCLQLGCDPSRIIFANPAKFEDEIEYAASVGVTKMTFDSEDELIKMKRAFMKVNNPNAPLPEPIVRLITDDSQSLCKFSAKFGAPVEDAEYLLQTAMDMGLHVIGTSYHVGSGCGSASAFTKAIADSKMVFDIAHALGQPMYMLDIGGGYPSCDDAKVPFTEMANTITEALNEYFPENMNAGKVDHTGTPLKPLHIIAEPGRYFAADTMTFISPVIARRLNYKLPSWIRKKGEENREPHICLTTADGLYGAYNGILYDHYTPCPPMPLFTDVHKRQYHDERAKKLIVSEGKVHDGNHSISTNSVNIIDGSTLVTSNTTTTNTPMESSIFRTKIFGPTCDGLDCIFQETPLPELSVGDWLLFPRMGAYSIAAQSSFNGIRRSPVKYFRSAKNQFDYSFTQQQQQQQQQHAQYASASS